MPQLSCVNSLDLMPLNPCDPLYQGDEICGADGPDSGVQANEQDMDSSVSPDSPDSEARDAGDPGPLPCLDEEGVILLGWCLIGDTCHPAGENDGEGGCGYCDPDLSNQSWTNRENGTPCTITGDPGSDSNGKEMTGLCEEGRCLTRECECHQVGFCCDGCHPTNQGEECFHSDLKCTRHICMDQGRCEQEVLDGWCLTDRNQCYHTMDNPNHCGECNHTCQAGQVCVQGQCVLQCWGRLVPCGEVCVDLLADKDHCGRCDRECPPSEVCLEGECTLDCAPGLTPCGEHCVDLNLDQAHCGECFNGCAPATRCEQGRCVIPVEGVSLNPPQISLDVGDTYLLIAHIQPGHATNQSLTWSTADQAVAQVTGDGLVTATGKGQTEITVTTNQGGHRATAAVQVGRAVTGVTLDHTYLSLSVGGTAKLTPTIHPSDADDPAVVWHSGNKQVVEVDQGGHLLARSYGETLITVMTADGGWTAQCQIVVTAVPVTGVAVTPEEITLEPGNTATLTASVSPGHATIQTIIWTTGDQGVAVVANGQITATGPGQTTITATSLDGNHQALCQVTVVIPVTGIELGPDPLRILPESTGQLEITVLPRNAINQEVTCQSEDQTVAIVEEATGLVTGMTDGQTQITCTTVEGGFSAVVTVEVRVPVTGIELSPASLKLQPGESSTLTAGLLPPEATNQSVTWHSSTPAVATVSPTGQVEGVDMGQTTITATTEEGGFQASCTVTVRVPVTGITLSPPALNLVARRTDKLTATVTPLNATDRQVIWNSSHPPTATVDDEGLVTAVAVGETAITATTLEGDHMATAPVTVEAPGTPAWSASFGGTGNNHAAAVAVDSLGNVYITGHFNSQVLSLGDGHLTSQAKDTAFLAKFTPEGEYLWGHSYPEPNKTCSTSLAIDSQNNVYMGGYYLSSNVTFGTQTHSRLGLSNGFLVKLSPSGEHLWSKNFGGNGTDQVTAIAVDPLDNVLLTGSFASTQITLDTERHRNHGLTNLFLVKIAPSGEYLWSKTFGGNKQDFPAALTVDKEGNGYLAGYFSSSRIQLGDETYGLTGLTDIFLVKLDPGGEPLWSHRITGRIPTPSLAVAVNQAGEVYFTGNFGPGTIQVGHLPLSPHGNIDIFLAKYTCSGQVIWAKHFGGRHDDTPTDIKLTREGDLYLSGYFYSPDISFGGENLLTQGSNDMFLALLTPLGEHLWSTSLGGTQNDQAHSIGLSPDGSPYLTGWYDSREIILGDQTFSGTNSYQIFLIKYR